MIVEAARPLIKSACVYFSTPWIVIVMPALLNEVYKALCHMQCTCVHKWLHQCAAPLLGWCVFEDNWSDHKVQIFLVLGLNSLNPVLICTVPRPFGNVFYGFCFGLQKIQSWQAVLNTFSRIAEKLRILQWCWSSGDAESAMFRQDMIVHQRVNLFSHHYSEQNMWSITFWAILVHCTWNFFLKLHFLWIKDNNVLFQQWHSLLPRYAPKGPELVSIKNCKL